MFADDDEDNEDARLLGLINKPHVTEPTTLPEPEDVRAFQAKLAGENKLSFNAVLAEPIGSYALGAFLEGKTDLFTQQPRTIRTPTDFVGVFSGRTQYTDNSGQARLEQDAQKAFPNFVASPVFAQYLALKLHADESTVSLESFELLRPLGKGAFGLVEAVRKTDTGCMYAMKKISKRIVLEKGAARAVITEKRVLAKNAGAMFACGLAYAFQTFKDGTGTMEVKRLGQEGNYGGEAFVEMGGACFLVVPLLLGGTLEHHIADQNITPAMAPFYGAQIALGLKEIHAKKVLHRDIKPENLMLDLRGNLMLVDFGVAMIRRGNNANKQKVGTPGYWAPEVINKSGAGSRSDFFSMGVVMYELLSGGKHPFRTLAQELQKPMDECTVEEEPSMDGFSEHAKHLVEGLLKKNPRERFTFNNVANHPFFMGIDWVGIEKKTAKAPFVPGDKKIYAMEACDIGDFDNDAGFAWDSKAEKYGAQDHKKFDGFESVNKLSVQAEFVGALSRGKLKIENLNSLSKLGSFSESKQAPKKKKSGKDNRIDSFSVDKITQMNKEAKTRPSFGGHNRVFQTPAEKKAAAQEAKERRKWLAREKKKKMLASRGKTSSSCLVQ